MYMLIRNSYWISAHLYIFSVPGKFCKVFSTTRYFYSSLFKCFSFVACVIVEMLLLSHFCFENFPPKLLSQASISSAFLLLQHIYIYIFFFHFWQYHKVIVWPKPLQVRETFFIRTNIPKGTHFPQRMWTLSFMQRNWKICGFHKTSMTQHTMYNKFIEFHIWPSIPFVQIDSYILSFL